MSKFKYVSPTKKGFKKTNIKDKDSLRIILKNIYDDNEEWKCQRFEDNYNTHKYVIYENDNYYLIEEFHNLKTILWNIPSFIKCVFNPHEKLSFKIRLYEEIFFQRKHGRYMEYSVNKKTFEQDWGWENV